MDITNQQVVTLAKEFAHSFNRGTLAITRDFASAGKTRLCRLYMTFPASVIANFLGHVQEFQVVCAGDTVFGFDFLNF